MDDARATGLVAPRNSFQWTLRELAEAAMSVTHHDASEHEVGYIHEVRSMEKRFARILKGKLKPMRRRALAASTKDMNHDA